MESVHDVIALDLSRLTTQVLLLGGTTAADSVPTLTIECPAERYPIANFVTVRPSGLVGAG